VEKPQGERKGPLTLKKKSRNLRNSIFLIPEIFRARAPPNPATSPEVNACRDTRD